MFPRAWLRPGFPGQSRFIPAISMNSLLLSQKYLGFVYWIFYDIMELFFKLLRYDRNTAGRFKKEILSLRDIYFNIHS